MKCTGSGAKCLGFNVAVPPGHCHTHCVTMAGSSISGCCGFLIYKMGMMTIPDGRVVVRP